MSAGEMAATIAVFEFPPRFSRSNHVRTESRYGMNSPFFFFFPGAKEADDDAYLRKFYLNFLISRICAARMRGHLVNSVPCGQTVLYADGSCNRVLDFNLISRPGGACKTHQEKNQHPHQKKSKWVSKGISRSRFPVAAKIALANAGAAGGTGGSPIPRITSAFSSPLTTILGV